MPDSFMSLEGNVTRDPEFRVLPDGTALVKFSVAVSSSYRKGDAWVEGPTSFFDVECWRGLAESVAVAVTKGQRVMVKGTPEQNRWENAEGQKQSRIICKAHEVGLSVRYAEKAGDKATPSAAATNLAALGTDQPF